MSPTLSSPWRILLDGRRTGAWNMAADAAILRAVEAGESPPTLRLYGWTPWCVSLGHFQKPERELDAAALRDRGWDFVLRPTGGRAVLHAEELTYSILARRDEAPWCATLAASYAHIGAAWAAALRDFGLDMVRGDSGADARADGTVGATHVPLNEAGQAESSPLRPVPTAPCFASSARSELAFDAPSGMKKVVGSAQRRTREAFVQHGSIPVTPDHERLVEVLPLDAAGRTDYLRVLRAHAVSLGEIAAVPDFRRHGGAAWKAWEEAIADTLLSALGVSGGPGILTPAEDSFARQREAEHQERQRIFLAHS